MIPSPLPGIDVRYGSLQRFQSGLVTPVSALRSAEGCGIGEFADLVPLGAWCREIGFDLIQILPVTDTGTDPSPYAGLSALALHPIHLRLTDLPGIDPFREEIAAFAAATADAGELDYAAVRGFKLDILRRLFGERGVVDLDDDLGAWAQANPWVRDYAAFRGLKDRHAERAWWEWGPLETVDRVWDREAERAWFHVWVQFATHRQLSAVSRELDAMGVRLKGDLPILLSEDSVDVWMHPDLFRRDVAAGAPPDMYATEGQNWSFPAYDWEQPGTGPWWTRRIQHAAQYYHAFRIDHVLGFFRLWEIPRVWKTGMLGAFRPGLPLTRESLHAAGFDDDAIARFLIPGGDPEATVEDEDDILADEDRERRAVRFARLWDRILVEVGGQLSFRWEFETTDQFAALSPSAQERLRELDRYLRELQQEVWEDTGRERLGPLVEASDMLPCAEDLGSMAECVPAVLEELGILKLCVDRWWRAGPGPDAPFPRASEIPTLAVATPSTHDSSTLRGWWQEDAPARAPMWEALDLDGPPASELDRDTQIRILARQFATDAAVCVVGLWELQDLDEDLRPEDPASNRINVPGTPSDHNWRWRFPAPVDRLDRPRIVDAIAPLLAARRARSFPPGDPTCRLDPTWTTSAPSSRPWTPTGPSWTTPAARRPWARWRSGSRSTSTGRWSRTGVPIPTRNWRRNVCSRRSAAWPIW